MKLPEVRSTILGLQKRRDEILLNLINFRLKMEQGSIIQKFNTCNKGNCKCTKGKPHGPFLYLSQKINDKLKLRYAGKPSDQSTIKRVQNYMKFQDSLAQFRKITKEIDSLLNLYRDSLTVTQQIKKNK